MHGKGLRAILHFFTRISALPLTVAGIGLLPYWENWSLVQL